MNAIVNQAVLESSPSARARFGLETVGIAISRCGLVLVLLPIGFLKFTAAEAAGVQPLIAHSPLMSWMYAVLGVRGVSNLIGTIEIILIKDVVLLGASFLTASEALGNRRS